MILGSRHRLTLTLASVVALVAAACREGPSITAPPSAPPEPAPTPSPPGPTPAPPQPQGNVPTVASCPLIVRLEVRKVSDALHELTVFAESLATVGQEIELPDRCPHGLVEFDGLGAGYDYYGTCNAGACIGTRPAQRIRVGAGERVPIASTKISDRGGTCAKPLSPGRYTIRPVVPEAIHACVVPALLDVAGAASPPRVLPPPVPPPLRPAPPPPIPVPPPPFAAPAGAMGTDIYSCTQASDCVLSCPKVAGCCSSSCGCRHAINKAHRTNYEAAYKTTCQKPPKCPVEGCAFNPAMGVDCRYGRCVATDRP